MPEIRKIVVLEDDRSTCALLASILEKEGYRVFQANEGRYAIELVIRERPALFISDVLVPDMNGSEVVKELNSLSFGDELNTIFLTSLLDKGDLDISEKRLKVGNRNYPALAKPLNPKAIIDIVKRIAGDPVVPEPIQVAVEQSIETQEEAANAVANEASGEAANEATDSEKSAESGVSEAETPAEASSDKAE